VEAALTACTLRDCEIRYNDVQIDWLKVKMPTMTCSDPVAHGQ